MHHHASTRRELITSAVGTAGVCVLGRRARAQSALPIRIGVIGDLSGPYQSYAGPQSVTAVTMAVEDFGGTVLGRPIEVLQADHQNKADVASAIARQWLSEGVSAIANLFNSSATLAIVGLLKEAKSCIGLITAAGSTRLSNEDCTPFSTQWVVDSNAFVNVTTKALTGQGRDTWFFLTMDFASGYDLESKASDAVRAGGGKVVGSIRHPIKTTDFSSYILSAQASKAKVVALASSGSDLIGCFKAAAEFGLTRPGSGQEIVTFSAMIDDVHSLGLKTAQGILLTEAFYWDQDEASRAWARRFASRVKAHEMPNMYRAGDYSATLHWLRAVQDAGTTEPLAVMAAMRARPVNDIFAKNGYVRPDGLMIHDMHLFRVKRPSESRGPWDYTSLFRRYQESRRSNLSQRADARLWRGSLR